MSADEKIRPGKWGRAGGLLVLGLILRLPGLNQSFWYDEIMAMVMFFSESWQKLLTEMPVPNHQPLYSLLGKLCLLALGPEEWKLRLPALVFGALTPPALYLFGRRRLGERVGLIAGLLMAVGMWPVWFSQDARGYSAMIFFSILAVDFFLRTVNRPGPRAAALTAGVGALAMYSHMYAGAVTGTLAAAGLMIFARRRDRNSAWFAAAGLGGLVLAALLYLPLLGDFYAFTVSQGRVTIGRAMNPRFVLDTLLTFGGGRYYQALAPLLLVPAGIGFALMARRRPLPTALLLSSMAVSIAAPVVTGTFVFHRFFAFWLPWIYLAFGFALESLLEWRPLAPGRRRAVVAVAGLLITFAVFSQVLPLIDYHRFGKQAFRPAAELARQLSASCSPPCPRRAIGLAAEVYWYYDRAAAESSLVPPTSRNIQGQVLVMSHKWSLTDEGMAQITSVCDPVRVFPSAGYPEYDVTVFKCREGGE